jgi:hypothetical protein
MHTGLLHQAQKRFGKEKTPAQQSAAPEGDLHLAQRVGLFLDAPLLEVDIVAFWQVLHIQGDESLGVNPDMQA